MNSLEKTHSQNWYSPLSPGASWSSNQKRPLWRQGVCAWRTGSWVLLQRTEAHVYPADKKERSSKTTLSASRISLVKEGCSPPGTFPGPWRGFKSQGSWESREPLTKVLNGDAPGVSLGMAKHKFFFFLRARKLNLKLIPSHWNKLSPSEFQNETKKNYQKLLVSVWYSDT